MEEELLRASQSTPASVRREQWRESQQVSIGSVDETNFEQESKERGHGLKPPDPLFRFDSSEAEQDSVRPGQQTGEEYEVCRYQSRSPHSSFSSPQVSSESPHFCLSPQISVDSPRISFSPLQIRDSIEEEETHGPHRSQSLTVPEHVIYQQPPSPRSSRGRPGPGHRSPLLRWQSPGHTLHPTPSPYSPHSSSSPRARSVSPISPAARSTPRSPTPGHFFGHYEQYFRSRFVEEQESYRRCMSDTDLASGWLSGRPSSCQSQDLPDTLENPKYDSVFYSTIRYPPKTSSVESDQSSLQEFPLDLSIRSSLSSTSTSESIATRFLFPGRKPPKLSSSSLHSLSSDKECSATTKKYNLEVSPVVEGPEGEGSYACSLCHQMFTVHDRLAKHMASRHKSRSTDSGCRAYPCDVCKRSFARSDMLTRHMRLHTGVKPYTCRACGQVFSRSDHLSTHQRTHTGEKPYRCPSCPYSACRRDMITRHLRTHTRYEHQDSSSIDEARPPAGRSISTDSEGHSKDLSEGRVSRDFSEGRLSWEMSRDTSDYRLSEMSDSRQLGTSEARYSDLSDSRLSDLPDGLTISRGEFPYGVLNEQSSKDSEEEMKREISEDNCSGSTG